MEIKAKIEQLLSKVIREEPVFSQAVNTGEINLEAPKLKQFGDYSSNIALVLSPQLNKPPLEIAQQIQRSFQKQLAGSKLAEKIEQIEVRGAGFINFFLSRDCLYEILLDIRRKGDSYGSGTLGAGKTVHLEFLSANPTGPLTVAHARQAAFGDTLANLLQFSGCRVIREYYLNDEGTQIDILRDSVRARYLTRLDPKAEFPASGYRGKYIDDLAEQIWRRYGRRLVKGSQKNLNFFTRFAYTKILEGIKKDLQAFGVKFDSWFSQRSLSKRGKIAKALDLLKTKGFLYQKEGAWWLRSTQFGDDKDRVVLKSDGTLTYIAADIAYHQIKFKRRFSQVINIWGPDHHGYIARLKAAVAALGFDQNLLTVLIVQLVSLSSAEKIIPMSTRMGQFVSLHDIIQAVGRDAARFFFLIRKRDSHLQFDLELAKKQSLENPVYYVQYAHARILNILKFAESAKGSKFRLNQGAELALLNQPEEFSLIQRLREFPGVVESCLLSLEAHKITSYLQDLAKALHHYYEKHKVVTQHESLTEARLILIDATRIVLKNGLRLLAISAPEKM